MYSIIVARIAKITNSIGNSFFCNAGARRVGVTELIMPVTQIIPLVVAIRICKILVRRLALLSLGFRELCAMRIDLLQQRQWIL